MKNGYVLFLGIRYIHVEKKEKIRKKVYKKSMKKGCKLCPFLDIRYKYTERKEGRKKKKKIYKKEKNANYIVSIYSVKMHTEKKRKKK